MCRQAVKLAWVALFISTLALAQYPNSGPSSYGTAQPNVIPEGTRFLVVLGDKLDTSKLKAGKKFKAALGEDLVAPDGAVIPRGKKVAGHVSSVERGFHARLLLSFDQIETQHGWVPLAATVTGVPGEHGAKNTGSEGEIARKGVDKTRAVESAAAGAAVGAVGGTLAAGPHGAIVGAAVGGAAGLGAGMLTDRDLTLQKGTQLELRLDRQLMVPTR